MIPAFIPNKNRNPAFGGVFHYPKSGRKKRFVSVIGKNTVTFPISPLAILPIA